MGGSDVGVRQLASRRTEVTRLSVQRSLRVACEVADRTVVKCSVPESGPSSSRTRPENPPGCGVYEPYGTIRLTSRFSNQGACRCGLQCSCYCVCSRQWVVTASKGLRFVTHVDHVRGVKGMFTLTFERTAHANLRKLRTLCQAVLHNAADSYLRRRRDSKFAQHALQYQVRC